MPARTGPPDRSILLEALLEDDLKPVRDAAISSFAARGKHAWPPELIVPGAWHQPYAASAAEIAAGLPVDVDEAAARVRRLIGAIDAG